MNRHRTDAVSLAFGAIFLLVAGWWLISRAVQITLPTVGWIAALGLIVLGAAGVFGTVRSQPQKSPAPEPPPWPDEPVD
jgi:hypothetical protein